MDLNEFNITQALSGLKNKKFSSLELTKACLAKINKVDSKIHAFITVSKDIALKQAKEADRLINQDKDVFLKKPLLGIPIALKDIYCTKNIKTTAASKVLENYTPQYSATVVLKYKYAGAVIIGKTNLDAWAHGASGENSQFYPTKNPWNFKYVPGGSSSGSAAALCYGGCLLAAGTDTGGSIRLPASFCNLVGLKPTYGRVSRYGIIAMASSLDSIGHFTKTVYDSALVLNVTAGKDIQDATTNIHKNNNNYIKNISKIDLKKIRIGIPKEYFTHGISSEVLKKVKNAVKLLENQGCQIKQVSLPHTKYAVAAYYIIQPAEVSSNLARFDGIRYGKSRQYFGDEAKRRIMIGTYTLSSGYYEAYYKKAMQIRTLIKNDFVNVFKQVDVLIAPVSPTPPFKLGEKSDKPLQMYLCDIFTGSINLAGLPALALPCGFTSNNLPIGMQIIGPQFNEQILFKLGHKFQQLTNHHLKKPNL
jgi:aspartyl-tRNA(Asn)/glutamyl-tRNA(Gln) amidotransferase subunit A